MTLEEKVKQIVVDSLHAEASQVTPAASFVNDLGADSLDQAELMMNIEDAFKQYVGDNIPEEDAAKFETVGSVIEFLKSKGVEGLDIDNNMRWTILKALAGVNAIDNARIDEELAKRRAEWQPREPKITTGYLARYAKLVSSSAKGAVLS